MPDVMGKPEYWVVKGLVSNLQKRPVMEELPLAVPRTVANVVGSLR